MFELWKVIALAGLTSPIDLSIGVKCSFLQPSEIEIQVCIFRQFNLMKPKGQINRPLKSPSATIRWGFIRINQKMDCFGQFHNELSIRLFLYVRTPGVWSYSIVGRTAFINLRKRKR